MRLIRRETEIECGNFLMMFMVQAALSVATKKGNSVFITWRWTSPLNFGEKVYDPAIDSVALS